MLGQVNFSGFNGFDFGAITDATIEAESAPLKIIQDQEKALRDKSSELGTLDSKIGDVQKPVKDLSGDTLFTKLTADSTDINITTVTLGDGATKSDYDLNVTQLAKGQVTASTNGYTNTTDMVADGGSISFTIGATTTTAINIAATTSLSELAGLINTQESGVFASVVNDGTNNKLVITSRETGTANGFTINNSLTSTGTVVAFAVGQSPTSGNSQDSKVATMTINGMAITSESNTVTDAIPGITATLVAVGTATINVAEDFDGLKETVKTFITEFNNLKEYFDTQSRLDSVTGKIGVLGGDTILRQAMADIRNTILNPNGNSGAYSYLTEVGIEFEQAGTLKLNEETLNTAIDKNLSDLKDLFRGDGTVDGVFDDMKAAMANIDGTAGLIKTTKDSITESLKGFRDRIAAQQLRLDLRRAELNKMFTAADLAMSRLTNSAGSLGSIAGR